MKNEHIFIIGIIIIIIYVTAMFIILEPVTNKLKRTCDKFGMTYVYREGASYCLDNNNILQPIYTECPPPYKRGVCEIIFIQLPT